MSGRSSTSWAEKNAKLINQRVLRNCYLTIKIIANELDINCE